MCKEDDTKNIVPILTFVKIALVLLSLGEFPVQLVAPSGMCVRYYGGGGVDSSGSR